MSNLSHHVGDHVAKNGLPSQCRPDPARGWREFVIQAFQSRSCETGYLPASLWGELASESNEHRDIIRTMYVRWGLALSQSFERVHSNEPVLRLPDVSMFGLAASTVLHGGFESQRNSRRRPPTREETLEIMLQV
jgi:hypothetical protein